MFSDLPADRVPNLGPTQCATTSHGRRTHNSTARAGRASARQCEVPEPRVRGAGSARWRSRARSQISTQLGSPGGSSAGQRGPQVGRLQLSPGRLQPLDHRALHRRRSQVPTAR
jgi:hypothetical protein